MHRLSENNVFDRKYLQIQVHQAESRDHARQTIETAFFILHSIITYYKNHANKCYLVRYIMSPQGGRSYILCAE